MNNTLTAKEWVYKYNKENGYNYSNENCDYFIMEKYANYRNRILEAKILEFRNFIKTGDEKIILPLELEYLIKKYDKHFNINKERI